MASLYRVAPTMQITGTDTLTGTTTTTDIPGWVLGASIGGGLFFVIVATILTYAIMICCFYKTREADRQKYLFAHSNCCTMMCVPVASCFLGCCCGCDQALMSVMHDSNRPPLVNPTSSAKFDDASAIHAASGPTSQITTMYHT